MTEDWRKVTFGDTAELVRDSIQPSECPDAPYVGLEHIGEGTLALTGHGVATDVSSLKSRFQRGDILFGKLRPYFRKVIRAPFDGICSTDIWVVRPTEEIDARYLFYVMASESFVEFATRGSEGTRMPRAQWEHVSQFELRLPPMEEQQRIAGVLGCLDDKIELNRRIAETLEQMARALFRSWFVDFEPVRAKQQGRWSPAQSLPGLPAHLYDAFPDRLTPSPLGPIPAGWQVAALGDCFELTMGQSPPGSTYNEHGDGLPFFQGRADFGFRYPTNRKFCTAPTRRAQPVDTLVSVRAPVGDINMAWEECCIGRGVAALRHKSGSTSFTYHAAQTLQPALRAYESEGTVFGAITKRQFESLEVLEPPVELIDAFDVEACRMDERLAIAAGENAGLAALREQALRHLLLAGQRATE